MFLFLLFKEVKIHFFYCYFKKSHKNDVHLITQPRITMEILSQVLLSNFFCRLGAATVRLEMPVNMQSALIFHYNLKLYNKETDNFEGISLKRFVMQVNKVCINKESNRVQGVILLIFLTSKLQLFYPSPGYLTQARLDYIGNKVISQVQVTSGICPAGLEHPAGVMHEDTLGRGPGVYTISF